MALGKLKPALAAPLLALGCLALAACQPSPEEDRANIERDILSTPGSEELWGAIKREYPEDFAQLIDRIQALNSTERRSEDMGKEIGQAWLKEFFAKIAPDSVKAPAEQLLVWSAAEAEVYAALQRSAPAECAKMTLGDWILIDDRDVTATTAISARNLAVVRAAAAGRDNPQDYAEPSEADFVQLGETISQTGLAPDLQATLGSEAEMRALRSRDQCQLGVAFHQGIVALPDELEPRLAAFLLAPVPD